MLVPRPVEVKGDRTEGDVSAATPEGESLEDLPVGHFTPTPSSGSGTGSPRSASPPPGKRPRPRWRGGPLSPLFRPRKGRQDRANRVRILNGGDQAQASAASRAGQHVEIERAPHQISPTPSGERSAPPPARRSRGRRRVRGDVAPTKQDRESRWQRVRGSPPRDPGRTRVRCVPDGVRPQQAGLMNLGVRKRPALTCLWPEELSCSGFSHRGEVYRTEHRMGAGRNASRSNLSRT